MPLTAVPTTHGYAFRQQRLMPPPSLHYLKLKKKCEVDYINPSPLCSANNCYWHNNCLTLLVSAILYVIIELLLLYIVVVAALSV